MTKEELKRSVSSSLINAIDTLGHASKWCGYAVTDLLSEKRLEEVISDLNHAEGWIKDALGSIKANVDYLDFLATSEEEGGENHD